MATWPPELRPFSAVLLPVIKRNSASMSGLTRKEVVLEPPVDGGGRADGHRVAGGDEAAEAGGLDLHGVGARLHRLEDVSAGAGRVGGERNSGAFIGEFDGGIGHKGAARILHYAEDARGGALGKQRSAGDKQRSNQYQTLNSHIGMVTVR